MVARLWAGGGGWTAAHQQAQTLSDAKWMVLEICVDNTQIEVGLNTLLR